MLVQLRIRLTRNILADKKLRRPKTDIDEEDPIMLRVFDDSQHHGNTDPDAKHPLDLEDWQKGVRQAISDLGLLHINASLIIFPNDIRKPRYIRYVRQFRPAGGRQLEEFFEAIQKGNILTIPTFIYNVEDEEEGALWPPTLEEFRRIMEYVGEHIGISPFGKAYGYGRFIIHSLETDNAIQPDTGRQPTEGGAVVEGGRESPDLHPQNDREAGLRIESGEEAAPHIPEAGA